MITADGHRIISSSNDDVQIVNTTRWNEIKETVEYHIQLSALLQAPTSFRVRTFKYIIFGHDKRGYD